MTTRTKAQLRKMDNVTLLHVANVAQRCLDESKAENRRGLIAYWGAQVAEIDAEKNRRVAAEAQ